MDCEFILSRPTGWLRRSGASPQQPRAQGRSLRWAIAILAFAAMMAGPTTAQEFRDWTLERDGDACVVSTRVLLRSTGTLLVAVSLSARGAEGALMAIEVPVGASLRDRVSYVHQPGAPERTLEWQFCNPDTCLAVADLEAEALHALKRGDRITVGFRPLPSSQVLAAPVSLMGLTRAWEALRACNEG